MKYVIKALVDNTYVESTTSYGFGYTTELTEAMKLDSIEKAIKTLFDRFAEGNVNNHRFTIVGVVEVLPTTPALKEVII